MLTVNQVLQEIKNEDKRDDVKKLFEEYEALKIASVETFQKLNDAEEKYKKTQEEIDDLHKKIKDIKNRDSHDEDLERAILSGDVAGVERMQAERAQNHTDLALQIIFLVEKEKLLKQTENNIRQLNSKIVPLYDKKKSIDEALAREGLTGSNYNLDNGIDCSSLKQTISTIKPDVNNETENKTDSPWSSQPQRAEKKKQEAINTSYFDHPNKLKDSLEKAGLTVEVKSESKWECKDKKNISYFINEGQVSTTSSSRAALSKTREIWMACEKNKLMQIARINNIGTAVTFSHAKKIEPTISSSIDEKKPIEVEARRVRKPS